MLKFIIYCLNVLAAVGGFQDVTDTPEPIEFKEVVAIQIDKVTKCLGAFVVAKGEESKFVATAAHCVYGVKSSKLELVIFGEVDSKKEIQVKRVMVHPYYMPPSPDYDIALLKINIKSENVGLPLNKDVLSLSTTFKAFDWNLEKNTTENIDATLEDINSCRAKMANHTVVSTRMLCADTGPSSVMDGSPLIYEKKTNDQNIKKYIVGVGSYYVRGSSEKYPKIFTNIANSEIYSFIEKYID